jgi:hypothetical protein
MRKKQMLRSLLTVLGSGIALVGMAQVPPAHNTENVIVVMIDGMRWQEVFRGADPELIKTLGPDALDGAKERTASAQQHYWRPTTTERRQALMPFLWSVVVAQGQIFGNRNLGSDSRVINGLNFSYPGYSETLTGVADPRAHSNDNIPNPNVTVFEWLNAKPAFTGKVAAFGAWEVFQGIFNQQRCGFVVNAGYDPLTAIPATPELALLNALKAEMVGTMRLCEWSASATSSSTRNALFSSHSFPREFISLRTPKRLSVFCGKRYPAPVAIAATPIPKATTSRRVR